MDFALCDRSLCYGCYDTAEPEHYVLREIYFDGWEQGNINSYDLYNDTAFGGIVYG